MSVRRPPCAVRDFLSGAFLGNRISTLMIFGMWVGLGLKLRMLNFERGTKRVTLVYLHHVNRCGHHKKFLIAKLDFIQVCGLSLNFYNNTLRKFYKFSDSRKTWTSPTLQSADWPISRQYHRPQVRKTVSYPEVYKYIQNPWWHMLIKYLICIIYVKNCPEHFSGTVWPTWMIFGMRVGLGPKVCMV